MLRGWRGWVERPAQKLMVAEPLATSLNTTSIPGLLQQEWGGQVEEGGGIREGRPSLAWCCAAGGGPGTRLPVPSVAASRDGAVARDETGVDNELPKLGGVDLLLDEALAGDTGLAEDLGGGERGTGPWRWCAARVVRGGGLGWRLALAILSFSSWDGMRKSRRSARSPAVLMWMSFSNSL